ncbi:hypothetical protein [Flavobacterium sp. CAU 1735]|uniref:hypothetical protein n=1 Tax=Flavobacterium sp. CAU 1735 TaxID=3140361 RepID=UPI003261AE01
MDYSGKTYGNEHNNPEGLSSGGQIGIGSLIHLTVDNYNRWRIKDWGNQVFSARNYNNAVNDVTNFFDSLYSSFKSLFGGSPKTQAQPIATPQFSNYQSTTGWQETGFNNAANSGVNHTIYQQDPPTKRERIAERLGKRFKRNENRIMAQSLVAEALLAITEPGELLTGFREHFDKVYGNQQSHDINKIYSQGIEIVKNIKNSFGAGEITDYMLLKTSASLYVNIIYLHAENSTLSTSIKYLDRNTYYKHVAPNERPRGGGFSGDGIGSGW